MNPTISSALLEAFVQYLVPVIFTGLAGLIGWALLALRQKLEAQAKESRVANIGARAVHFAEVVTQDLEATLKPEIARVTLDGHISKEEATQLKTTALQRVKALLAERGLKELQSVLGVGAGQVDTYLSGVIERAVAQLPRKEPAGVGVSSSPL